MDKCLVCGAPSEMNYCSKSCYMNRKRGKRKELTMDKIQRLCLDFCGSGKSSDCIKKEHNGDFVKFSDHEKAIKEERKRAVLEYDSKVFYIEDKEYLTGKWDYKRIFNTIVKNSKKALKELKERENG